MAIIRWILLGNLEKGLMSFVLIRSGAILFCTYMSGYYAWTFLSFLDPETVILKGAFFVSTLVTFSLLLVYGFRFVTACWIGIGATCVFLVGLGVIYPDNVILGLPGAWSVIRGFAVGPKLNYRV